MDLLLLWVRKTMNEYLQQGTKASSMRLGFITSVYCSTYGGLLLGTLDIVLNKGANLIGVAAIIGAMSGTAYYGKQAQAKTENKKDGV